MAKRADNTLWWVGGGIIGGFLLWSWSRRAKIVSTARSFVGTTYRLGGSSKTSIDCSGLTMRAYEAVGVKLPHKALEQRKMGTEIPESEISAGDLVYWNSGGGPHDHVGIYGGNGQVIHASSVYGKAVVDTLETWKKKKWLSGIRRLL